MSDLAQTLTPSRDAARTRAQAYRESERQHREMFETADLPQVREKHRVAAERYAVLADSEERLADSPARAPILVETAETTS